MTQHIKTFSDGSTLEFDNGKFDAWCVYFAENGNRRAPRDREYFEKLKTLALRYSKEKIYKDFVEIYDATNSTIEPKVLCRITNISSEYGADSLSLDKLFTILYAGMVAEENKDNAILKKKIKRLGMHQLLFDGLTPEQAADFSKGKKWQELNAECAKRNF